ncbi:hypothetical protein [Paenibacillus periandrae]|uniref:hypothetical protein n=1 Tax=Paenibacillus periandrae TaxID=1761741 RepID=UPI001F0922BC|nr:hypothetical protein [Paenibacillus periandrae]
MFAQYFGQFLLNRSLVTASALDQALSAQAETRVKLGALAINKGYMTPEQAEKVHQTQTRMDKRFGEIAVDMGLLTEEVVTELLSSQQSAHLTLGQALIDQGTMNYETFSTALILYKKDYSLTDDQFESIVNGSIEALVESILLKQNMILEQALTDYISLFAKNMIRFIDSHIRIEIIPTDSAAVYEWTAYQSLISSDRSLSRVTAISAAEASFLQLASIYAQESIEEPGEMMEASVGELLNLHNGIYLVNLSNRGIELDLEPQAVVRSTAFSPGSPIKVVLRALGPLVQFDLILTDLNKLAESA